MEGGEKKTLAAPFLFLFSVKPASTELRALSRSGSGFRGGRGAVRKEERALFSRCASHVDGFFLPLGQAAHNLSLSSKIRAVGEHGRRMSPEVCRKRVRTVVGAIRASETSEKRNKKEKEKTCEGTKYLWLHFPSEPQRPLSRQEKKKGEGGAILFALSLSRALSLSLFCCTPASSASNAAAARPLPGGFDKRQRQRGRCCASSSPSCPSFASLEEPSTTPMPPSSNPPPRSPHGGRLLLFIRRQQRRR